MGLRGLPGTYLFRIRFVNKPHVPVHSRLAGSWQVVHSSSASTRRPAEVGEAAMVE